MAKPSLAPISTKNVPSVTMKLGSRVLSTTVPLNQPIISANASESGTARCSVSPAPPNWPTSFESRITSIAVAPVIAPDERSNSPPIISSETATAMIPNPAATSR